MKSLDNLIPYVLASMHPLMHMSMLATSLIMVTLDQKNFYNTPGTCPATAVDALEFMSTGKHMLMFYIMSAHLAAIVLHYLYQVLNHYDYKTAANVLLMLKVVTYFYTVVEVQTQITYMECAEVTDNSVVMAWLTYEVVVFYLNIISVALFLVIASFGRYKTIRERLGYAGSLRKYQDYLAYCMEDLHWW